MLNHPPRRRRIPPAHLRRRFPVRSFNPARMAPVPPSADHETPAVIATVIAAAVAVVVSAATTAAIDFNLPDTAAAGMTTATAAAEEGDSIDATSATKAGV